MKRVSADLVRVLIIAALALWLLYLLRLVLLPFLAAGAVACVAEPAIQWACRRVSWPRWVVALLAFFVVLALVGAAGYAIVVVGLPEFQSTIQQLPKEVEAILSHLFGGHDLHLFGTSVSAKDVANDLQAGMKNFIEPSSVLRIASAAAAAGMGAFLSLVLILYFLLQGPRLVEGALWLVPPRYRPAASRLAERMFPVIWHYIGGMAVIVAWASIVTWLVMRWLLGVQHAMLIALAVGILELIPVLGPALSAALIGAVAISHGSVGSVMGFAAFAFALRLSIDQLLGPIILGKAMSLPAPVIILAMLAGGALWGVLGVVIAVPGAALIRIALQMAYEEEPTAAGTDSGRDFSAGS